MKVRVNVSIRLVGDDPARLFAGDDLELPDAQARDLISRGEAVEVVVEEANSETDLAVDAGDKPRKPKAAAKKVADVGSALPEGR